MIGGKKLKFTDIQDAKDKHELIQSRMRKPGPDQEPTILDYEHQYIHLPQHDEFVFNSQDLSIEGNAKTFIDYVERSFETLVDILMNLRRMKLDVKNSMHHHLTRKDLQDAVQTHISEIERQQKRKVGWVERANIVSSFLNMRWLDKNQKPVQTFCFPHQVNRINHWREIYKSAVRNGVKKIILIYKDMTEQTYNEITMTKSTIAKKGLDMCIQDFSLFDLVVNLRRCEIVPKQTLLTPSEADAVVRSTHSGPNAFPLVLEKDIMMRYMDATHQTLVSTEINGPDGPMTFISMVKEDMQSAFE